MVLTILKWVGVAMVLSLIALWLWQGGYWKIAEYASIIPNPLDAASSSGMYQLPGQPEFFTVPDTTGTAEEYGASDYQNPSDAMFDPGVYNPSGSERSPYAGYVELQIGGADNADPQTEYIVIHASDTAGIPIPVSGWSVRSAYTGRRAVIPLAASPFYQGVVNTVAPIVLGTGESVLFATGVSPIGVSFRETTCTGYLAQTQTFTPQLSNSCPRPTELMPRNSANAARYGGPCLDYVERLPQCSYPATLPDDISTTCRAFLTNTFTYTGCMRTYATNGLTNMSTWRAYNSSSEELWQNAHDAIQLLDGQGRIVTEINY